MMRKYYRNRHHTFLAALAEQQKKKAEEEQRLAQRDRVVTSIQPVARQPTLVNQVDQRGISVDDAL